MGFPVKFFCLLSFVFLWFFLAAQQSVHVVKPKETLYSISKQHGISVEDLKKKNNLSSNEIFIGQQLQIASSIFPEQKSHSVSAASSQHIVKPGETLYSISRSYNITVNELKQWNRLNSNEISIGQSLLVSQNTRDIIDKKETTTKAVAEKDDRWTKKEPSNEDEKVDDEADIGINENEDDWPAESTAEELEEPKMYIEPKNETATFASPLRPAPNEKIQNENSKDNFNSTRNTADKAITSSNKYSEYLQHIKHGDAALKAGNYSAAITSYSAAQKLMPERDYPKWRIKEIESKTKTAPVHSNSSSPKELTSKSQKPQPALSASTTVKGSSSSKENATTKQATGKVKPDETQEKETLSIPPDAVKTTTHFAMLKTKPSDFGKNIALLNEDTEVLIIGSDTRLRNYYQVKTDAGTGWICGRNIKKVKEVKSFKESRK